MGSEGTQVGTLWVPKVVSILQMGSEGTQVGTLWVLKIKTAFFIAFQESQVLFK